MDKFRKKFPVFISKKDLVYLDNACSVLKSQNVIDTVTQYYSELGGCAGRSSHVLARELDPMISDVRMKVANFIGAESLNEIVFTSGTTEGINLVANSFPYSPERNEVIITDLEHNSNVLPFYELQKKGIIKMRIFETESDGSVDLKKIANFVNEKTALVSMTQSSNVIGGAYPIKEIAEIAHEKGAKILVDNAQYIPTHPENVRDKDIDLMVFSGHKVGGPTGIGVLYGKQEVLEKMKRYKVGGGTIRDVKKDKDEMSVQYLKPPAFFEAGVQNYAGILGLGAAVEELENVSMLKIRQHVSGLVEHAYDKLSHFEGLEILGSKEGILQGSVVTFSLKDGLSESDFNIFAQMNSDKQFAFRTGMHCANLLFQKFKQKSSIRISFFAYNTKEEIDEFIELLNQFLES